MVWLSASVCVCAWGTCPQPGMRTHAAMCEAHCASDPIPVRAKKTLTSSGVVAQPPAPPSSMLLRAVRCQISSHIVNIEEGGAGGS